ncbi:MAG: type II toxin-antitoxin system Phd/YefM family antitoxin [Akkermansiaceae bacterium]
MKQVGLYEAKSKLSALVSALIESGDPVSLTKHGQVVAELRPPSSRPPSRGSMSTDNFFISPDFDRPSPEFDRLNDQDPPESPRK